MPSLKDHNGYLAKLQEIQDADAARLDAFRQADQDRRALFEAVMAKYKDLLAEHEYLTSDMNDLKLANRTLNHPIKELGEELDTLKHEQESNSMVGVFIDGDGAKFHEKFIKDGVEGGELAAQNMKDAIKKELKGIYLGKNTDNWQIMESFRRFAVGLNRGADYNFNVIDVGGGRELKLKEITDAKLRETFKTMLPHCRHVFFAGCHDEGYVTFLSPYKHNQQIVPKITLLETSGTRPKYHDLGFGMTKFPAIFRSEDFPPRAPSYPPTASSVSLLEEQPNRTSGASSPFSSIENRAPAPVTSATTAAPGSWASSTRNGLPASKTIDIMPKTRASDSSVKKYYLVNSQNERVDEPLPKTTTQMYEQFNARLQNENRGLKFCNQCIFYGPETCNRLAEFRHGRVPLPPGEALVLKQLVRNQMCSETSWCADPSCPYGHHCKFNPNCSKGGIASLHLLIMSIPYVDRRTKPLALLSPDSSRD